GGRSAGSNSITSSVVAHADAARRDSPNFERRRIEQPLRRLVRASRSDAIKSTGRGDRQGAGVCTGSRMRYGGPRRGGETMPKDSLTITDNRTGKQYEIPIEHNAIRSTDLR